MITLTYYRFILDPDTAEHVITAPNRPLDKVMYHKSFDHEQILPDSQCDFSRACNCAKAFLKNHYGYVVIRQLNQDEYSTKQNSVKIGNRKKFYFDMLRNDVLIVPEL